jgi:hypothetical protein
MIIHEEEMSAGRGKHSSCIANRLPSAARYRPVSGPCANQITTKWKVGMTRTDADVNSMSRRPSRRALLHRLLALPAALALLAVLAAPALAAEEPTSSYNHPSTSKQETLPSKSKTTPKSEPAPTETTSTTTTPTTTTPATTAPAKQSTLPFTGLNLTWVVAFGLLLICAGGSIVMVQRRQRRSDR